MYIPVEHLHWATISFCFCAKEVIVKALHHRFTVRTLLHFILSVFVTVSAQHSWGASLTEREHLFDQAVCHFKAGKFPAAYGKFVRAAAHNDTDAARFALHMYQYGPLLYGSYWDASSEDLDLWVKLASNPTRRADPPFNVASRKTIKGSTGLVMPNACR